MERRKNEGRRWYDTDRGAYVIALSVSIIWGVLIGSCTTFAVVKFLQQHVLSLLTFWLGYVIIGGKVGGYYGYFTSI